MSKPNLSVLMPVYNEMGTIADVIEIVRRALPEVRKELIIIDDGSRDGTREWLASNFGPVEHERDVPAPPTRAAVDDGCTVRVRPHVRTLVNSCTRC
jgi:glycosyltransferase involved in cell wall biosynthesis